MSESEEASIRADCDQCGERYYGANISRYMVEVYDEKNDGWVWLCRNHGVSVNEEP